MFRLFSRYQLTLETEVTPSGCLTPVTSWQIALQLPVTHQQVLVVATFILGARSMNHLNHYFKNCKEII